MSTYPSTAATSAPAPASPPPPSSTKLFDLRPERHLLNANFDGYKLTLQPLPKLRTVLGAPPSRRHATDAQYSYLHAQLFGTHNALVRDPFCSGRYYFVDAALAIRQIRYAPDAGRLAGTVRSVYVDAAPGERQPGDYNATLAFVSGKVALLADGSGGLSVLETGERHSAEEEEEEEEEEEVEEESLWRRSGPVVRPLDDIEQQDAEKAIDDADDDDADDQSAPFVLLDARFDAAAVPRRVHCVLLHIRKRSACEAAAFEAVIDVVELTDATKTKTPANRWQCRRMRRIRSQGWPYYCALEARGAAVLLAGDREFVLDDEAKPQTEEAQTAEETAITYEWHQQRDEIIIALDVKAPPSGSGLQPADIRVVSERRRVCVTTSTGNNDAPAAPLLQLELYGDIDAARTTWLLENETLKLTLVKRAARETETETETEKPDEDWPRLLANETKAEADGKRSEFIENGRRDAFAMAGDEMEDLEDCDFAGNDAGRDFFWERIDLGTMRRTHKCHLGTNAPLFAVPLRAGQPAALALRCDVDVCVWQAAAAAAAAAAPDDSWRPQHVGTLDALGYVQASKTQKKYVQCSPDMRYAVISEAQRHVFIYQARCEAAAGLTNRRTGAKAAAAAATNVGQQRLFTMDGGAAGAEIVGMQVDDEVTLLLTEKEVIAVQINA